MYLHDVQTRLAWEAGEGLGALDQSVASWEERQVASLASGGGQWMDKTMDTEQAEG